MTGIVQPQIALIVDHPQRDLAGLVLTAAALCQRGAICHLVPRSKREKDVWALTPDFVLLNYLRRGSEPFATALVRAGIAIGVLDTEGGVWPEPSKYTELLWPEADLRAKIECACLWGPRLAEYVIQNGFLSARQVSITGCPRFDVYRKPRTNSSLLHRSSGNGSRKQLLLNTNFTVTNPKFATSEQNSEAVRRRFGWSAEELQRIKQAEQQAISGFIDLASRLSRDFPHIEVVLRPHPFENPAEYQQRLAGRDNVIVNALGSIQDQITRSVAVIQRSCTTALESALAAIPTLSPLWIPAPFLNPMAEAVSEPCNTYEDLAALLRRIGSRDHQVPPAVAEAREKIICDWFSSIDGRSHERVADALWRCLELRSRRSTVDRTYCARRLYRMQDNRSDWPSSLIRNLRYWSGLSPDWSFRRMRAASSPPPAERGFTAADVRDWLTRLTGCASHPMPRVTVLPSNEHPRYRSAYRGHSVALYTEQ